MAEVWDVQQWEKLNLTLETRRNAPCEMVRGAAVAHGSVGYFSSWGSHDVFAYDSEKDDWSKLPKCPQKDFGLAVVDNLLTAVGGYSTNYTNDLVSFRDSKWAIIFPPMPTKRHSLVTISAQNYLAAAGGVGVGVTVLSTVEVMNVATQEWYTAASLPEPIYVTSATVCGRRLYLLGGLDKNVNSTRVVFTCTLYFLLHSCHLPSQTPPHSSEAGVWQRIADVPMGHSTCTTLNGRVLAVGGEDSDCIDTANVWVYGTDSNSWPLGGHMSTARSSCLVVGLRDCIIAVGGYTLRYNTTSSVEVGYLQLSAKPPKITSQPTSQKDAILGKAVAFSVQATGTEPLRYQWQWKQFGRKGEKDGWQNLPGKGSTFQVRSVKSSNAGYYWCVVSNSAGSERSQHASLTVAPELADLVRELQDVNDWVTLGLYLGIKMSKLKEIEADYQKLARRRTQMLHEWQKRMTPTWSAVVQALVGIGKRHLAYELAQKHGTPPPKLPDSDPLDQPENLPQRKEEATASMLYEEMQKLRGDLKQDRKKLAEAEECLRQSQESKVKANEKANEAVTKLEELHKNVQKIAQEKSNLEGELKVKEQEYQLLSTVHEKDEELNQDLKKKIDKKRKKIKRLKEELQSMDSELQSALQEVQMGQKELSQAQNKLKKQHKEVIQLQKENEEVACSYNIEKEQVSKIVQLLVSDKEEMQQQLTSMKEESEQKSQKIETCNADITHLSEEIKILSSSLQKKEAAAAQLQSELQKREQVASTQLLTFIELRVQIAELERKLQEAEEQKQKAELEREATVQETKAKEKLKAQLHAQLGEPLKGINHPPKHLSPGTAPVQTSKPETLQLPLQLKWRRYRDMEYAMTEYPRCVVLERSVYVGGGLTGYVGDDEYYIQEYNMKTNKWSRLPGYGYMYFAMTVINHHLTLVGGWRGVGVGWEVTNQLAAYEPSSQQWTFPYNPMPTPRYRPAVLMYDIWLLVAGGGHARWTALATVELFNTSTNQWLAASSLPTPCGLLTSAIVDNYGYLVVNSKQVFRVSLPDIVSQAVNQSTSKSPTLWCRLPDTPLSYSTAISLRGYLLAVGGYHDNGTRTDIHLYQPESEQWTKVGDLPNAREYCSCVVLSSGELLVAGGRESSGQRTSRVDVASVLN